MTLMEATQSTKKRWIKPEILERSSLADAQFRKGINLVEAIINNISVGATS